MTREVRAVTVADLFCGAGGTATGAALACRRLGLPLRLVAVNHWPVAVATHAAAHPEAAHFCQDLALLQPREAVPGGRLDLLMASPACTFHSRARGGRPMADQQRQDPWHLLPWLTELQVRRLLVENVPEFVRWGPVSAATSRPEKSRGGAYFLAWLRAIRDLGWQME